MLWITGIFTIILIIAFGTISYLAYRVIDEKPFDIPAKTPDMDASASVYKKLDLVSTLMSAFKSHKKGVAVEKVKTVELNEKEVNAVIISTLVFAQQAMPEKNGVKELRDAYFSSGAFTVMLSKKMIFNTPFGNYLNFRFTFVPEIKKSHLTVEARGIRIGSIEFPLSYIKDKIDGEVYNIEKSPDGQAILGIVSELNVEKEKMTVVYNPDKLLKFMMEKGLVNGGGMIGGGTAPASDK